MDEGEFLTDSSTMGYRMGGILPSFGKSEKRLVLRDKQGGARFFCLFVLVNFVLMKFVLMKFFWANLSCTLINRETTMAAYRRS